MRLEWARAADGSPQDLLAVGDGGARYFIRRIFREGGYAVRFNGALIRRTEKQLEAKAAAQAFEYERAKE